MNNKDRIQHMQQRLQQTLQPSKLEIIDESHLHIGHAGAKTGKGHFAIIIHAAAFSGKTRIQQHRLIYQVLGELMENEIHALRIQSQAS